MRRIATGPLSALVVGGLLLVACGDGTEGGDAATEGGDPATEGAADVEEDAGEEEAGGDGDAEASTFTFNGEDLALDNVVCEEQFDHDGVQMSAYAPFEDDPVEQKVLRVKQRDEGAFVRVYRAADISVEFDGHEWRLSASDEEQVQDIDWDGASAGPLDLGISQGNDEDEEAEDATIEFDLAC